MHLSPAARDGVIRLPQLIGGDTQQRSFLILKEGGRLLAAKLPGVHGMSPTAPGAARRTSHGKIVLRVGA
jgi:hypothetical protein